jgi:tetratricopeptide (TPR) repeat protein
VTGASSGDDPPVADATRIPRPGERGVVIDSGVVGQGDVHLTGGNVAGRDVVFLEHPIDQPAKTSPTLFRLPPDIGDFTGRQIVASRVQRLLTVPPNATALAIVAIAGAPGIGKTALALHVAHGLLPNFFDGQLYVDLRGAEAEGLEPAAVLGEFLRALGVEASAIPEGLAERAGLYRAKLANQRVLVLLDNAADEVQVRPLLPGSSSCAVLITSRTQLAGLEGARFVDLEVLGSEEAVQLLAAIAGPDRISAEWPEAQALAELCGRLPLALRIAGAKLAAKRHWRLATLVQRLQGERRRLTELRVGDLEVRASFDLSYHGLPEDERRIFRLLGLLKAPDFQSWVAAALLDSSLMEAGDLMERLVERQVIEVARTDPMQRSRYRFHDLLRDYARERLRDEEPVTHQQEALARVLGSYLELSDRASSFLQCGSLEILRPPKAKRWPVPDLGLVESVENNPTGWFSAERVSLVLAVEQAFEVGATEATRELAGNLVRFFSLRSYWGDWLRTQELALLASRLDQDQEAEADTLLGLGAVYRESDRLNDAHTCFNQCLPIFRELGDRRGEAWALYAIGDVYSDQNRFSEALTCFDQCLPTFRDAGDRRGEAWTLVAFGVVHRVQTRFDLALTYFGEALPVLQELGDRRGAGYTLINLGIVYRVQSRIDEALVCFDEALPIFRELDDRRGEGYIQYNLGEAYLSDARLDDALVSFERCQRIFHEVGDRAGAAVAVRGLGEVHRHQSRLDEAFACFQECLPVFREVGDLRQEAFTLLGLGSVYYAKNRWRDALHSLDLSLARLREVGDQLSEAKAANLRSLVFSALREQETVEGSPRPRQDETGRPSKRGNR